MLNQRSETESHEEMLFKIICKLAKTQNKNALDLLESKEKINCEDDFITAAFVLAWEGYHEAVNFMMEKSQTGLRILIAS